MADDQSQRTYRASEPPVRGQAKAPSNDPLAELARLIGQTDPFGEYGRAAGRPTSPLPAEYPDWSNQPARSSYGEHGGLDARQPAGSQRSSADRFYSGRPAPVEVASDASQNYGRQSYGSAPVAGEDYYQSQDEARYAANQGEYQQDAYEQDAAQYGEEEYYEEAPPSRRRFAVMAIAGVCALAIVGTAGAFGYRALFGSSTANQPPPVIKADAGPTKIVPAASGKDAQSSKLITERVNERGQSEKLVSREEQPIDKPATVVLSQAVQQSALGSGVVGSEPKKVRTIAIRPDQTADAMPQGVAAVAAAPPTRSPAQAPRAAAPAPRPSADNSISEPEPSANSAAAARGAPPVRQATPAPNVPLSLSPEASPARTQERAQPSQTAAIPPQAAAPAPTASSSPGGGTFVQVSSQRSEGEAQAAYRSLQAKYPNQLNGRELSIQKADLGSKGTYYRAMIGPFASANEAGEWCSSLKAAGGQCLIPRN
jgi:SPOR domain